MECEFALRRHHHVHYGLHHMRRKPTVSLDHRCPEARPRCPARCAAPEAPHPRVPMQVFRAPFRHGAAHGRPLQGDTMSTRGAASARTCARTHLPVRPHARCNEPHCQQRLKPALRMPVEDYNRSHECSIWSARKERNNDSAAITGYGAAGEPSFPTTAARLQNWTPLRNGPESEAT